MKRMPSALSLIAILLAFACAAHADDNQTSEQALIEILRSDAPKAEKAITCKRLAVYGSAAAVPDLAKLLPDEQLSSWARIALEAIPGSEADDALLTATDSLQGKLLVGVINSLGVRHPEKATSALTAKLGSDDVDVASAAAVALGHIGTTEAAEALRPLLAQAPMKLRSAVAEGCVLCAERAWTDGRDADAIALYDEVRQADVPPQRVLEATRGAILARKDDGIPLLIEHLRSNDRGLFRIALSTAREVSGSKVDQALAEELAQTVPERAALLLYAMADRPQTVVLSAVQQAAEHGPKEVRLVAIGALGRVGNESCLPPLLNIAQENDAAVADAAMAALSVLPGAPVDRNIVAQLDEAQGKKYRLLIELVGARRIDALAPLLKAINDPDESIRAAALTSLGYTVPPDQLSVLISSVVSPKHPEDEKAAQQALKTAAIRMPDREACAEELAEALENSPLATKVVLLEILGAVAGTKSLETIAAAAKSPESSLQDVSTRLLGEWMTVDAAPVLLDLAKTGPGFRTRALRGYIRIARQFVKSSDERIEMCRQAFAAATQPAEQRLLLDVLRRTPQMESLILAIQASDEFSDVKDEALQAALSIAASSPLAGQAAEVKDLLSHVELEKVKLEIVKAEYGAGGDQRDVTEAVQKAAGDVQWIALPSDSYNESFGGDPAPGSAKKLTIHYRLNDKEGEASFAENALVILPMPK